MLRKTIALFFFPLAALIFTPFAQANVLRNCFTRSSKAQFFANDIYSTSSRNETPVLLLSVEGQVVGVLGVSEQLDDNNKVQALRVGTLELCSRLEVSTFYYADNESSDLKNWLQIPLAEMTQDEGRIEMKLEVFQSLTYSDLIKVQFQAYDVFNDDNDWTIPVGSGEFYFYLPKKWR